MGVIIDSNILIGVEKGLIDLNAKVLGRENESFYLSVISVSELLHGVERALENKTRALRAAFVEAIIERFPICPITVPIARAHSKLWAMLSSTGSMIGMNDSWIAASCLALNFSLVTANSREFERVPGLIVENWSVN